MTIVERAYVRQDHGEDCGLNGFGFRARVISLGNAPDNSKSGSEVRVYTDYPEKGGKLKKTVAAEYSGSAMANLEGKSNKGTEYICLDCGVEGIRFTISTRRCKPCQTQHERKLRRRQLDKRADKRKEVAAKIRKELNIPCTHSYRETCDLCRDKIVAFRAHNRKRVEQGVVK